MTPAEAAAILDGDEYLSEGSPELFEQMKAAGLVAVFGASDDLMEFRGAIHDEEGCYGGGTVYVTTEGVLKNECDDAECPYFLKLQASIGVPIEGERDIEDFTFVFETTMPHATFIIKEERANYCRGIVFALADAKTSLTLAVPSGQ